MTAPTRTRGKPATAPPERKSGRKGSGDRGGSRGAAGTRSAAAERAYARRAQRVDQARRSATGDSASGAGEGTSPGMRGRFRPRLPRSRASFVLLIMAMLATGVVATLWLTTQAIAGSYKLERLHEHNAELAERVAQLERVVTKRESATWLAERARQLGMVPGGTPAKLVVHPDGSVTVVGEPKQVTAPAPPPAPAPEPPPPEPAAEPEPTAGEGSADDEQQAQGDDSEQAPPDRNAAEQEAGDQGTQAAGEGG